MAVLTVYPSLDGYTARLTDGTWTEIISGNGNSKSYTNPVLLALFDINTTATPDEWSIMRRAGVKFDTSALGAGVTISDAVLSFYFDSRTDPDSNTPSLNIYSAVLNDVNSDYESMGTTEFANTITYAGWSAGFNDFTLNASGLANINKTGNTDFGIRNTEYDVGGVDPAWSASPAFTRIFVKPSEIAGTTQDPKLVITYTASGGDVTVEPSLISLSIDVLSATVSISSVSVSVSPLLISLKIDNPHPTVSFFDFPGKIKVTIDGVDRTSLIKLNSFSLTQVLTRQIDTGRFTLRYDGQTKIYTPSIGNEIIVTKGDTKIFAGIITKIKKGSSIYKMIDIEVEFSDYGRKLDRYLINDSFSNQTISQIINFLIVDKGLDEEGFTTNNVDSDKEVAYIAFNYQPMSEVLIALADLINYDWYVDYDKDIHFFSKEETSAPFEVEDDTGTFIFNTMVIREDSSQVKNVIYVRGGEYLGETTTSDYISDGIQNVYPLDYKYDSMQVSVTGEVWNGGVDGVDIAGDFDYMWNPEEKFIRFRGDRIPSDTSSLKMSGPPFLPVVVKLRDPASIATFSAQEGGNGEYEYIVIDKTINSREGARERARAEIDSYAMSINEGEFKTYANGLRTGQRIRINSLAFDVDDYFIINRVSIRMRTPNEFEYVVSLVTTKTMGIIDFLRETLLGDKKNITINENEILDVVEAFNETLSLADTLTGEPSTSHNPQTESASLDVTFTSQGLDYDVEFVLAGYVWGGPGSGDNKREMILDVTSYLY